MLLRPAAVVFFSTLGVLSAAEAAKPREESMRSDRFAEAHAPLFQPPKSNQAGALTQKIAASLPLSGAAAVNVPVNNFIDKFIFARIAKRRHSARPALHRLRIPAPRFPRSHRPRSGFR